MDGIIQLVLIITSFIVILTIKQWAADFVGWRRFKTNLGVQLGSVIRLYAGDYIVEGRVIRANMKRIILETSNLYVMIPMSEFKQRVWYIKKSQPTYEEQIKFQNFCLECPYKFKSNSSNEVYDLNDLEKNKKVEPPAEE